MNIKIKNTLAIGLMFLFSFIAANAQTNTVVVYETSGTVSQKNITGASLYTMRTLPYNAGNNDLTGLSNEYYDVFFSDPTGTQVTKKTDCVTIRGQYDGGGQGFNISRVDFNNGSFAQYYTSVASFTMGTGGTPGSQVNAVDQTTSTTTSFGRASGQKFMHITLCELKEIPTIDVCCPPINPEIISQQLFYKGRSNIADDYTLKFQPTATFKNQIQQYTNYIKATNPIITRFHIIWNLVDCGSGPTAACPAVWAPIESNGTLWVPGGNGTHTWWGQQYFFGGTVDDPNTQKYDDRFPMKVGTWYKIHTWSSFDDIWIRNGECSNNFILVRIQVMMAAKGGSSEPTLEVSNGKEIIKRIPLREISKPSERQ
jgi:hypothetical protein